MSDDTRNLVQDDIFAIDNTPRANPIYERIQLENPGPYTHVLKLKSNLNNINPYTFSNPRDVNLGTSTPLDLQTNYTIEIKRPNEKPLEEGVYVMSAW